MWSTINALADRFGDVHVIVEDPGSRGAFLARRARLQGWFAVAGQFGIVCPVRSRKALFQRRIAWITESEGLDVGLGPRAEQPLRKVASVNPADVLTAIDNIQPAVILLAACRFPKPSVLARITSPILNHHAGITPQYRGINGGYRAKGIS